MTDIEKVTIESDEWGFELHIVVGDDIAVDDQGRAVLNIQGVAEELLHEVVQKIGPWLLEGHHARREYVSGIADDPSEQEALDRIRGDGEDAGLWPGESALDFYRRTGDRELLLEQADELRKRRMEQGDERLLRVLKEGGEDGGV